MSGTGSDFAARNHKMRGYNLATMDGSCRWIPLGDCIPDPSGGVISGSDFMAAAYPNAGKGGDDVRIYTINGTYQKSYNRNNANSVKTTQQRLSLLGYGTLKAE